jgi:hypothetical protein
VSLARLTQAQRATVDNLLARAEARFDAAETAAKRPDAKPGEYDNNFDGVVSGIYHVLDAFHLATTGLHRSTGQADAPTAMASTLTALGAAGIEAPSLRELAELNRDRNASVHGGVLESPFGTEDLDEAVDIGRAFARAVREYLSRAGRA